MIYPSYPSILESWPAAKQPRLLVNIVRKCDEPKKYFVLLKDEGVEAWPQQVCVQDATLEVDAGWISELPSPHVFWKDQSVCQTLSKVDRVFKNPKVKVESAEKCRGYEAKPPDLNFWTWNPRKPSGHARFECKDTCCDSLKLCPKPSGFDCLKNRSFWAELCHHKLFHNSSGASTRAVFAVSQQFVTRREPGKSCKAESRCVIQGRFWGFLCHTVLYCFISKNPERTVLCTMMNLGDSRVSGLPKSLWTQRTSF